MPVSLRGGGANIPVYYGTPNQYGRGLGNILGSLFRFAVPLIKKGAKFMAPSVARMAGNVTQDILRGKNVGATIKRRGKETAKRIGSRVIRRAARRFRGGGLRQSAPTSYQSVLYGGELAEPEQKTGRSKKKRKKTSVTIVRSKIAVTKQKGRGRINQKKPIKKRKNVKPSEGGSSRKRAALFSRYNF